MYRIHIDCLRGEKRLFLCSLFFLSRRETLLRERERERESGNEKGLREGVVAGEGKRISHRWIVKGVQGKYREGFIGRESVCVIAVKVNVRRGKCVCL